MKGNKMATTKIVNYTAEQTMRAIQEYQSGATVETIATLLGKSTRSIVAKLSREGVYKAKEYVAKNGTKPIPKEALAEALKGFVPELTDSEIDSLTKANKGALNKLLNAFAK
jgi:hypothetical protein